MAKRIKQQANVAPVPKDMAEARKFMRLIGDHQRDAARIEHDLNDQVAALREKYAALAAPHNKQSEEHIEGLRIWAEASRDELTNSGKKKTVDLGTGELGWRMRPPRVLLRNMPGVIESLQMLNLDRFLRQKTEVNKEAVLAEPEIAEQVKGITVKQTEDFFVVPAEDELGEAA